MLGQKPWKQRIDDWREILAYTRGEAITVTPRCIQNWMAAFRRAEAESGCGYLGLLDQVAERGNRNARVPDASKQLLIGVFEHPLRCSTGQTGGGSLSAVSRGDARSKALLPLASEPFTANAHALPLKK